MPDYGELFHAHEVMHKEAVLRDTWGHLAPKIGKVYFGTIVYTHTEWGHNELISMSFDNLDSSPWFYDHMNDYIFKLSSLQDVGIYKFIGVYRLFKNSNHRFTGKTFKLVI